MNIQLSGHQVAPQLTKTKEQARLSSTLPLFSEAPFEDRIQIRFGRNTRVETQQAFLQQVKNEGVLIAGAGGLMGNEIGMNTMNYGFPVYGQDFTAFKDGIQTQMEAAYASAVKTGFMTKEQVNKTLALLKDVVGGIDDTLKTYPQKPALVIEAIKENLDAKTQLFSKLDEYLDKDTILASNTSSLSINKLAASTNRPENFVGLHYFLHANKNRLIEIIPNDQTSEATLQKVEAFARATGKNVIRLKKDSPGFVVNRIGIPMINEGVRLYDEMKKADDAQYNQFLASAIDQVAFETLWPTGSQKPSLAQKIREKILLPIDTLNKPAYMGLIGEISEVLDEGLKNQYGDAYRAPKTVQEKFEFVEQLIKEVKQKTENGMSGDNARAWKNQQMADARIPMLESSEPLDIPPKLYQKIQNNLLGSVMGVAGQLIDEGVCTLEDIERGTKAGFGWEVGPFEIMNTLGVKKANALVQAYSKARPGFKAAESITSQIKVGHISLNFVDTRREGNVQFITINKPQESHRNNALDAEVIQGIRSALKAANADSEVKQIVIEGIGNKSFSSGADLPWLQAQVAAYKNSKIMNFVPKKLPASIPVLGKIQPREALTYFNVVKPFLLDGHKLMDEIAASPKVTIAKVVGNALGGGAELVLACDYSVAGESANIGTPEVLHGIFPAWGGTERLADRIGLPLAKWMVLAGGLMGKGGKGEAILNGQDAFTIGLVDKVAPDTQLDAVIQKAIDEGEFTKEKAKENHMGRIDYQRDLSGTRFAEAQQKYATQSIAELLDGDLKGYYDTIADEEIRSQMKATYQKVLKLAFNRVEKNLKAHPPRDLQLMVTNMAKVGGLRKEAAKMAKAVRAQTEAS